MNDDVKYRELREIEDAAIAYLAKSLTTVDRIAAFQAGVEFQRQRQAKSAK